MSDAELKTMVTIPMTPEMMSEAIALIALHRATKTVAAVGIGFTRRGVQRNLMGCKLR